MSPSPDINDLLQTPACPICGQTAVDELRPAAYPDGATREQILKVYSSSSDQTLMDRLVRCRGCGLVYTSPRIKDEVIHASYSDAVDPVFVAQDALRIVTFRRSFRRVCADLHVAPDKSKRVLDIGCAGGAFVKAAQDVGFTAVGIEPSRWLADRAKATYGIDVRPGMLRDHSFPDGSFSFVSLWDVIEHLTDPGRELDAIRRLLADDGHFVVNYPDYGSLVCRLMGRKWPFFLSVHLFYFTRGTITRLLKKHAFDVLFIRPHLQTLELGYALERAGKIFSPFNLLAKLVTAVGLAQVPLRYNIGQSLLVARKSRP